MRTYPGRDPDDCTLDQFYGLLTRVPLTQDERTARNTARLVRESQLEQSARVTPEPDDDE